MKPEYLKGIIPAFMSGFTDNNENIDTARIRSLAQYLIDKGVNGLYVGGSSGEMLLCSVEERKILLETVISESNNKITVISHVGCTGTRETVELARHAAKAGANAVSSVTPLYFAYSFAEVKQYYKDIADASGLPVIIYNIPARTGMTLNAEQLHELLLIPGVAGMKFTSSDFFMLERLVSEHPDHVFYNGSDEMLLSGLAAGADGGIGTTYNFMPEVFVSILDSFKKNKIAEARYAQSTANRIIKTLLKYGAVQASKYLIKLNGIDYGECRRPFMPLTEEAKKELMENSFKPLEEWRRR